jgi:hypothetical protein
MVAKVAKTFGVDAEIRKSWRLPLRRLFLDPALRVRRVFTEW